MSVKTTMAVLAALVVGAGVRPVADWLIDQAAGGPDVRCVADGNICKGMPVAAAFDFRLDDHLGGVLDVSCGFTKPGAGAANQMSPLQLMASDCLEPKYMISFSNGRRLTNVWVDRGRIVRLDDYPRHTWDL